MAVAVGLAELSKEDWLPTCVVLAATGGGKDNFGAAVWATGSGSVLGPGSSLLEIKARASFSWSALEHASLQSRYVSRLF